MQKPNNFTEEERKNSNSFFLRPQTYKDRNRAAELEEMRLHSRKNEARIRRYLYEGLKLSNGWPAKRAVKKFLRLFEPDFGPFYYTNMAIGDRVDRPVKVFIETGEITEVGSCKWI